MHAPLVGHGQDVHPLVYYTKDYKAIYKWGFRILKMPNRDMAQNKLETTDLDSLHDHPLYSQTVLCS